MRRCVTSAMCWWMAVGSLGCQTPGVEGGRPWPGPAAVAAEEEAVAERVSMYMWASPGPASGLTGLRAAASEAAPGPPMRAAAAARARAYSGRAGGAAGSVTTVLGTAVAREVVEEPRRRVEATAAAAEVEVGVGAEVGVGVEVSVEDEVDGVVAADADDAEALRRANDDLRGSLTSVGGTVRGDGSGPGTAAEAGGTCRGSMLMLPLRADGDDGGGAAEDEKADQSTEGGAGGWCAMAAAAAAGVAGLSVI